jgi:hypothetical protein
MVEVDKINLLSFGQGQMREQIHGFGNERMWNLAHIAIGRSLKQRRKVVKEMILPAEDHQPLACKRIIPLERAM